jgi:hypothetical protein
MYENRIQESIAYLFRQSHTEDDWIHPLPDVLDSVTHEQAAWSPAPGVASIWELAQHAANYLEDLANDLEGRDAAEHEDWQAITDKSENAWNAVRRQVRAGTERVLAAIERLDEQTAHEAPAGRQKTRFQRIADIAIHDAYHCGQVVKLRQLYEASHSGTRAAVAAN